MLTAVRRERRLACRSIYEGHAAALHRIGSGPPQYNAIRWTRCLGPQATQFDFGELLVRILAVALGACSAFFLFYEVRLLVVTGFLQQVRSSGQGAYIGAIAFPIIAVGLGLASRGLWRRASRRPPA